MHQCSRESNNGGSTRDTHRSWQRREQRGNEQRSFAKVSRGLCHGDGRATWLHVENVSTIVARSEGISMLSSWREANHTMHEIRFQCISSKRVPIPLLCLYTQRIRKCHVKIAQPCAKFENSSRYFQVIGIRPHTEGEHTCLVHV